MLFKAIIARELRISSRNWRTYYSRVAVGAWALALCIYLIWLVQTALGGATAGTIILQTSSMLALALCLFSGVNRTADSISSEKREDTLGLLFLTHLKGRDIVLGKLFAHGLRTFYLLVAIIPVLGVPIFLGGVTGSELFRVPLALMNALLLSLSVGLFISSVAWSQRLAHGWAGTIMVLLAFVLPASAFLVQRFANIPRLTLALNLPSPTYTLLMSGGSAIGLTTNFFWSALVLQFGLAIIALSGACGCLPHFWRIKAARGWTFKQWIARIAHGDSEVRAKRRFRILERNPIFWLNCRDRFAVFWPVLFALLSFGVATGCIVYFEVESEPRLVILFITLALNDFAMRIRVGSLASLRLGIDRQSGALEMILSSPLTVREVIGGVWKAIRGTLLWTYVPILILYCVTALIFLRSVGGTAIVAAFFLLFSVADFVAMGYVAMWNGMRMRNIQQAAGHALLRVLILPWTVWAMLMPLVVQFPFEIGGFFGFGLALILWATSTGLAIRSARRNLFGHFREAATDRYNFEERTSLVAFARRWFERFLTPILPGNRRRALADSR